MQNKEPGMTFIVKTITRLTVGLILIYAVYITLQGHISPGGGFAGGVIIALSFIHLLLAYGKEAVLKTVNEKRSLWFSCVAALILIVLAKFGFMSTGNASVHSGHFRLFSGGLIPLYDIAIAVMVGSGLFLIFLSIVLLGGNRPK